MCGRFALTGGVKSLFKSFGMPFLPVFAPRYNIAPSQPLLAIINDTDLKRYTHDFFVWGLVPPWAETPALGSQMINARSETLSFKVSFKSALKHRRCIIPASGFFEWKPSGKSKQPYYISRGVQSEQAFPLLLAGLWEVWHGEGGEEMRTCTIITTSSNKDMSPIHNRMPVIFDPATAKQWLSEDLEQKYAKTLVKIPFKGKLIAQKVGGIVNNAKNDVPECIQSIEISQPVQLTFF